MCISYVMYTAGRLSGIIFKACLILRREQYPDFKQLNSNSNYAMGVQCNLLD